MFDAETGDTVRARTLGGREHSHHRLPAAIGSLAPLPAKYTIPVVPQDLATTLPAFA